ncbi:MAG: 7-cyano-7-deazaguanine synthase QueC [Candidatus Goldiibacteriota bacterium]|jgi:7-cyano-7-deazaguanine synthase
MKTKCLVLLSGGQDSTTCLFWAKKKFGITETVSFDYGQRHRIELKSAAKIAGLAGVKNSVIVIKEFEAIKYSALLDLKADVSKKHSLNKDLPATFVPGRNILFLTAAAALAYTKGIKNIVIGVSQVDYSGYPDCRGEFIKSMEKSLSLGMEYPLKIHTPLIKLDKKKTVLLAKKLGALDIMKHTHTCYEGANPPCGKCPACLLREKGFKEAGIKDPLKA